jgi:hypothetical protein
MPTPDETRAPRHRRRLAATVTAVTLLATGVAVTLRHDDGGTPTGETAGAGPASETTPEEAAAAHAECMRDEGVEEFPEATVEEDGSVIFEARVVSDDPDFEAAHETCSPAFEEAMGGVRRDSEPQELEPMDAGWEEVVPGGDCRCADGSEYSFYARDADPTKVVLFLDGGGACWSAETCDPEGANEYQRTVEPPNGEGIFDFDDERNPLADSSFVYVPYCTGDVHLGDATADYAPGLTVEHKGFVNGTAALDHLATTFPDATEVVVVGASAGAVSAPTYAGLVADRMPDAHVTSIADSGGSYPDDRSFDDIMFEGPWGLDGTLPDWPEGYGPDGERASVPGLTVAAGRHDAGITFARYDHAHDENQALHVRLVGFAYDDLLDLIDANEALIEDGGVEVASFTAPGDDHVVFDNDSLYTESVDGVALVDWVSRVLAGEPVDDVHCTDCS